jgi:polysaccharide biosynthesis transport protein
MEFIEYFRILRKWWWLFILSAVLSGGVAFIQKANQPAVYQAQALVAIGNFIDAPNPDYTAINIPFLIAQTYLELSQTYQVLEETVESLALPMPPEALRGLVSVSIVEGTSLLAIKATYTDPVMTADIANGLAESMIVNSPTNLTTEQQTQIDLATLQIEALNDQVASARNQLAGVEEELEQTLNIARRDDLNDQRNVLIEQINQATNTIATFSNNIMSVQQRSNILTIVEEARVPNNALPSNILSSTMIGIFVGLVLVAGFAVLMEYLDDRVRTSDQAAALLNVPVVGSIPRFGRRGDGYRERMVSNQPAMSPIVESYRTLRTNMLFTLDTQQEKPMLIVSSPGPVEGKSTTTSNLAITMAQAGMRVLLIDADLRRPKLHEIFDLPNEHGLTTLLFADPSSAGGLLSGESEYVVESNRVKIDLRQCLQTTEVPNLRVITSGFQPANPTEILGSALMQRWVSAFRASSNVDIVIIDTPPCLIISDSTVLASSLKSAVFLVIDALKTRRIGAVKAKEQFEKVGVNLKGVIVNRVNPRDEDYGYGYGYGYYYQSQDGTKAPRAKAMNKSAVAK